MRNKFISRLLLLVTILVALYSCRNNELFSEAETFDNSSQFKLSSKTIRLDQSKHKLVLKTELQKAVTSLQKVKTNLFGKTVDYSNVFIDTDNVTYIENGPNFYTYTFNLIRENAPENALIENLILAPKADGTYKEILVTYNLTAQEKKAILNGKNVSTKGKSYIMELSSNTFNPIASKSQSCSWVEADSYTWCSEGVHHNGEGSGSCTASVKSQIIKVMLLKCESIDDGSGNTGGGGTGGGTGDSGGGGGSGTGPGSGGGTPTEPCNGNGVATGPLEPSTDIGDGTNCSGIPTTPTLSTFFIYVKNLPADLKALINDASNNEFYEGLKSYYDASNASENSKNIIRWALAFKQNNSITWEQFLPMLQFTDNFIAENPDTLNPEQLFTRLKDLDNALIQNPNLLIDIPCSQLPEWQELANHPIPTSVKNRIFQINGQTNWFSSSVIQNLDYSSSFTINMDVYPVKISNMPEKAPGVKYTPAEFFDHFRRNINDFTDVNHGKFYPVVESQYGINDTQLWNSTNPLGSLVTIKIPADNGTVVCSGFGPQAWIFTTVKSPWDGEHPVSGNRLFGYFIDGSGNMVIYTRGVDRFTTKVSNNALQYTVESFGYSEAQKMWKTMQQKLSSFVNNNSGNSSIIPGVDYTPSYIFIKDYLKGKKPLTSLGCH